ncbi:MAG: substrate-binding domain-containing protein [Lachnospiraceae bacterium]|nr:substrate-binding domain-containing protein [Lachnospiraceae bacterium]
MRKSRTIVAAMLVAATLVTGLTGCGQDSGSEGKAANDNITVITRESGSGTRGAFIELFGIEEKDADGNKVDNTIATAEETNSTAVMITSVEGNESAIGYISLGALKDSVKALKVDGVEATTDNVKSGSYKVARPFNVATKEDASDAAKEFINYIMSKEGQEVINEAGYIGSDDAEAYVKTEGISGKVVVGGSSSVSPVMEKLIEAYEKVNSDIEIELQQSDSTTGMTNAIAGTYDIGMASRELKDEEAAELTGTTIAMDGIAVIVNKSNDIDEITSDQVKNIYTGKTSKWSEVK